MKKHFCYNIFKEVIVVYYYLIDVVCFIVVLIITIYHHERVLKSDRKNIIFFQYVILLFFSIIVNILRTVIFNYEVPSIILYLITVVNSLLYPVLTGLLSVVDDAIAPVPSPASLENIPL